jgi:hypothetical protein
LSFRPSIFSRLCSNFFPMAAFALERSAPGE